jgi:hypothetical protein
MLRNAGAWRRLFDASPNELGDLLVFSRAQDARITSRVLAGEVVEIPIVVEGSPDTGDVEIREAEEDPPPRLAAFRHGQVMGYVRAEHPVTVALDVAEDSAGVALVAGASGPRGDVDSTCSSTSTSFRCFRVIAPRHGSVTPDAVHVPGSCG